MSGFNGLVITEAGSAVLAKAQAGQPLVYTRIVLGDGYIPSGKTAEAMTNLVNPVVTLGITKCDVNRGQAIIGGILLAGAISEGFYSREFGLFALDPDTEDEVLYSYGNKGDLAGFVEAGEGAVQERAIDFVTAVGSAASVSAVIDSTMFARIKDINDLKNMIEHIELTPGKSAYELAVDEGFEGTLHEWLDSLHGENGTNGVDGTPGVDGKSAFQSAVEGGFTGSEAQFNSALAKLAAVLLLNDGKIYVIKNGQFIASPYRESIIAADEATAIQNSALDLARDYYTNES